MRTNHSLDKLEVVLEESRVSRWDMANQPVRGRESFYRVVDHNYRKRNVWQFAVRVPHASCRDRNIQIQPVSDPPAAEWEGLERRVITFVPAEKGIHAGKVYCKITFQDWSGNRNKVGARRGERSLFPPWMGPLRHRMRLKATVKDTMGNDPEAQVIVLQPDDHRRMIGIFFATKVWVQKERVSIR
jgi:hypothetical protein